MRIFCIHPSNYPRFFFPSEPLPSLPPSLHNPALFVVVPDTRQSPSLMTSISPPSLIDGGCLLIAQHRKGYILNKSMAILFGIQICTRLTTAFTPRLRGLTVTALYRSLGLQEGHITDGTTHEGVPYSLRASRSIRTVMGGLIVLINMRAHSKVKILSNTKVADDKKGSDLSGLK
jgi:hypothetical protein